MAAKSEDSPRTGLFLPTLVVLFGAALRVLNLATLPPGVFYDEGANGVDALRVLNGLHPVFFPGDQGREPIFIYLQAATIALIGPSPLALRLPAAFIGVITIAVVYATFRSMGGPLVGTVGATLVAFSYWMVSLSRLAFRTDAMPLLLTLSVFWTWKALRTGRLEQWLLGGGFLGLALYSYIPARLAPALLGAWLLLCLARPSLREISTSRLILGSIVMGIAFVVVALPISRYFLQHPSAFTGRIEAAARPNLDPTDIPGGFVRAVQGLIWIGDPNPRQNLPGRPLIEVTTVLSGALGGAIALRRRDPAALFCLLWSLAMIVPASLGDEPAHALRLAGVLPFVFYLPARGLATIASLRPSTRWLVAGMMVLTGLWTARDYFGVWANRPDVQHGFQADLAHPLVLARQVPPGAPLLVTSDAYEGYPIPLVFFPAVSSIARGFDGQNNFVAPATLAGPTYYLYGSDYEPTDGVPIRDQLTQVAESHDVTGGVDGRLYRADTPPTLPPPERELTARVGGAVKIVGADVPKVMQPGQTSRIALYWTVEGELPPGQWEFLAHLVSRDHQQLIAQDYNHGFPPSQWHEGDQVISWFDLTVPDNAAATVADLDFGIFDPQTGQRLAVTQPNGAPAGNDVVVGPTRIDRPAPVPAPQHPLSLRLGSHVLLDGYDLTKRSDGSLVLQLHWHADGLVDRDYTVFAHRLDNQGKFLVAADGEPASGTFPTSTWVSGEEVLDTHVLPPAPNASQIEFGMYLLATGQRLPFVDSLSGKPSGDSVRIGN